MFGLFFEVIPKAGHAKHYFEHVLALRDELSHQTGLLWLDRYSCHSDDAGILSHQLWRDMASIDCWRSNHKHSQAQTAGRNQHFSNYRIRIGKRLGCVGTRSLLHADTRLAGPHHLIATAHYKALISVGADGLVFWESVSEAPAGLVMAQFEASKDGLVTAKNWFHQQQQNDCFVRGEIFVITIDYGMFERDQAPEMRVHSRAFNG